MSVISHKTEAGILTIGCTDDEVGFELKHKGLAYYCEMTTSEIADLGLTTDEFREHIKTAPTIHISDDEPDSCAVKWEYLDQKYVSARDIEIYLHRDLHAELDDAKEEIARLRAIIAGTQDTLNTVMTV